MARFSSVLALLAVSSVGPALAHPGHDIEAEIKQRAEFQNSPQYRSLDHCASAIKARDAKMVGRRQNVVDKLREKRGLAKRDIDEVLATDHQSGLAVTPESSVEEIFGTSATCILQGEVTEGPYYVSGELVRQDITEDEAGVPFTFDIQIVDTTTCEPLSEVALEAWYCNATGVYSGITARGNGDNTDESNLSNTALRGIQYSDDDGILQFDGIFPGHYTGRAPHVHILAHIGAETAENGTLTGGTISHVGQLFVDQSLITEVELLEPYSTNTQPLTTNAQDGIMSQQAETSDPVFNYVLIDNEVSSGVFGWITVGIDPTNEKTVRPAGHYDG